MLRTSIQACGTATTTLAKPKPSPSISTTRRSASGIISRSRSSPVTPRWIDPCASALGDLGGRQIGDLHVRQIRDRAAIVANAARLDQRKPGAGEERLGVLLQAALGRHRDDERRAHAASPQAMTRSIQTAKPTAGDRRLRAEPGQQSVVAAAGDQLAGDARAGSCSSNTKPV